MIREELRPTLDLASALREAEDIAREVSGCIARGVVPNFNEVDRLCELVLGLSDAVADATERSSS